MATHSGTLAWETPWMEEPGRLQSLGVMVFLADRTWGLETMKRNRRKEGNGGPKSLVNKGALFMAVCAYILLYKETLGKKIELSKTTKTRCIATVTEGTTIIGL